MEREAAVALISPFASFHKALTCWHDAACSNRSGTHLFHGLNGKIYSFGTFVFVMGAKREPACFVCSYWSLVGHVAFGPHPLACCACFNHEFIPSSSILCLLPWKLGHNLLAFERTAAPNLLLHLLVAYLLSCHWFPVPNLLLHLLDACLLSHRCYRHQTYSCTCGIA